MTIGADLSPSIGRARFLSKWAIFSQAAVVAGPLAISGSLLVFSLPVACTLIGALGLAGGLWALACQPITQLPTGTRMVGDD